MSADQPRRRIAVVVQRYAPAVTGGAESHARLLVQALATRHDVTVLTSCALDHAGWQMDLPEGADRVDGVPVLRFAHPHRNDGGRARVPRRHKLRFLASGLLDAGGRARVAQPTGQDDGDGHLYLRRQGPACTGLIRALHDGARHWDAAVFFTALYYPTAEGLPAWGRRSVLVPTLHDEKAMYLPWFHRVFESAGLTLFNTAAEQRLARRLYGRSIGASALVGAGVRVPAPVTSVRIDSARRRFGLPERYLAYVGRVEAAKGCADLLRAWQVASAGLPADTAIVFIGGGDMTVPASPRTVRTGFIDVDLRDALIAGSAAMLVPSRHESLSLALLEGFALGVPAVANAASEVLLDHLAASGAGVAYRGHAALVDAIRQALLRPAAERAQLGERGRDYVGTHFDPQRVHQQWLQAVEQVCEPVAVS